MFEKYLESVGFYNFNNSFDKLIVKAREMAKNTFKKEYSGDNAFSNEESKIKIDKYSKASNIKGCILVIDIGGTHTKCAVFENEEPTFLFDEDNDWFKGKSLDYKLGLENFINTIAKNIKTKYKNYSNISGLAIVWSNAIRAVNVENKDYTGISGVTIGVNSCFYEKGEWFNDDLYDDYDLGEAFYNIFSKKGIKISTIIIANDTVFTLKALEFADAGVVISSGANATGIGDDNTIYNLESGAMFKLNRDELSLVDPFKDEFMLQYLCAGKWQHIFLKEYIIAASKYGIKEFDNFAKDLEKNNFLVVQDMSSSLYGDFPYKEKYEEAKECFFKLCKALERRAALAGALLVYTSIANRVANRVDGEKYFKIALDSGVARHLPSFFKYLKEDLDKIIKNVDNNVDNDVDKKVDIILLEPKGHVTVPMFGAYNSVRKY
ncbi:MAG: hypothetical protein ACOX3T_00635 [Bdellovibrionota bacterium]